MSRNIKRMPKPIAVIWYFRAIKTPMERTKLKDFSIENSLTIKMLSMKFLMGKVKEVVIRR